MTLRTWTALAAAVLLTAATPMPPRVSLDDESDRAAFRSWFALLADAQFERATSDVVDCAALVRHAYREALRAHTPEWYRQTQLPLTVSFPDVRRAPVATSDGWPLFRIARQPERFGEFADAATMIALNARAVGRDPRAAEPGDLFYFRHEDARAPAHLMVFVGTSMFDPARRDWLVYHTGPDGRSAGEVRKIALADLARHPSPRWRPVAENPTFVGVFRLAILDRRR